MTKEQLEHMDKEKLLVEYLAQRVVEKLLQRQKRALVVFTGAMLGAEEAVNSLAKLREEGYQLWLLFSESGAKRLSVEEIRTKLTPQEVWIGSPTCTPEQLSAEFDTIIVPTATVYTASQVALCMASSPSSSVILDGLMRGKRVILATDGCCPDNPKRMERGFHIPPAMKETMRSHLRLLESYGARLTSARGIVRAVRQAPEGDRNSKNETPKPTSQPGSKGTELRVDGHVISGSHIRACPPGGTVWVASDALITQLARDEARTRGVSIRKLT